MAAEIDCAATGGGGAPAAGCVDTAEEAGERRGKARLSGLSVLG